MFQAISLLKYLLKTKREAARENLQKNGMKIVAEETFSARRRNEDDNNV